MQLGPDIFDMGIQRLAQIENLALGFIDTKGLPGRLPAGRLPTRAHNSRGLNVTMDEFHPQLFSIMGKVNEQNMKSF